MVNNLISLFIAVCQDGMYSQHCSHISYAFRLRDSVFAFSSELIMPSLALSENKFTSCSFGALIYFGIIIIISIIISIILPKRSILPYLLLERGIIIT